MNHVYRVVFNRALGVYQCVSEIAKSRGKSSGKSQVTMTSASSKRSFVLNPLMLALLAVSAPAMADITFDDGQTTVLNNDIAVDEIVTISNGSKVTGSEMVFGLTASATLDINTAGSLVSND